MKKAVTLEIWVDNSLSNGEECVEEVIQEAMSHYYCLDGTIEIKVVENTHEGLVTKKKETFNGSVGSESFKNIDFNKVKEEYVCQLKRQELINKIKRIKKENNKKELSYKLAMEIEDEVYKINDIEDLNRFISKYKCTKYQLLLGGF